MRITARNRSRQMFAVGCVGAMAASATAAFAARPIPIGTAHTTVQYEDHSGTVTIAGDRNFNGAANLPQYLMGGNVRSFSANNTFGRRYDLDNSQPMFSHVIGPDETLVAHSFFKNDIDGDYFPGIALQHDSHVTVSVTGMVFDQPVTVLESTFLFHTRWDEDQTVDAGLEHPYSGHGAHNFHTETDPFRNFDDFISGGVFSDFEHHNFALNDVQPVFSGNGTPGSPLSMTMSLPYDMLINLGEHHDMPQAVLPGFPAPGGFLEPYHFHFEYVVTPEPTTLAMVGAALLILRRRLAE
ncbi:MAG: hypothetical protein HOP29_01100 [Phycisphaerales bacterium]|nr:hypothetical protein [Phycisphaerales bacterium]